MYNDYNPDPSLSNRAVDEARASLGEHDCEAARERGWEMSVEEAVAFALS